jgi:branched-chain amino acid transport system permease protein
VLFLSIPLIIKDIYWIHVLIIGGVYAVLALSWDLLAGHTGLVSFGHAAFFGVGAYTSALISLYFGLPVWFTIIVGGMVAAVIGLVLGIITLRLSGPYFCITTLGFSQIIWLIIVNEENVTRGPLGLSTPPLTGIPKSPALYRFWSYYIMAAFLLISIYIMDKILKSKIGLAFKAIQNDEIAANTRGINVTHYRLLSFGISTFFAGFIGGFYAHYVPLISPEILSLGANFTIIAMTIFGGIGTFFGPIFGAFLFTILTEYLRVFYMYRYLIFGALVAIMITLAPRGIFGLCESLINVLFKFKTSKGQIVHDRAGGT